MYFKLETLSGWNKVSYQYTDQNTAPKEVYTMVPNDMIRNVKHVIIEKGRSSRI